MSSSQKEINTVMDLSDWAEVTFNEKEIPLSILVDAMKEDPDRFVLHRSKQYPSSSLLWDTDSDDLVIGTHAFVVKYASPIETGNFVPDDYEIPEGMFEYLRKTEPGPMAQIFVTYDCRMDDSILGYLQYLEDWVKSQQSFDIAKRKRNPWMSPSYVANNLKYTMTSQLFQTKTAFNCKQDGYSVNYPVHEWIEENCYPHNPAWIPNPNVVQFYELQDGVLRDMRHIEDPVLHGGDIAKASFKIVASKARETWNMGFIPIQIVRVGKIDRSSMAPFMQLEDHKPVQLPGDGDQIILTKRKFQKRRPMRAKYSDSESGSSQHSMASVSRRKAGVKSKQGPEKAASGAKTLPTGGHRSEAASVDADTFQGANELSEAESMMSPLTEREENNCEGDQRLVAFDPEAPDEVKQLLKEVFGTTNTSQTAKRPKRKGRGKEI
ncbi:hypothetical protein NMY22_g8397 [Coprinellus aureogranulatus]|nr:hypothetical protein NMY22_g8397 [Coprinellus aureogranulatus]